MDITQKTDVEIKAIAFDIMIDLERGQNNLRLINNELAKRAAPKDIVPEEPKA